MSAILTATDIVVRYNDRCVLDGASLTIDERDRIGVVGRNGSGKSTFLKVVARVLPPDAGEITQRRDLVIGYLPQNFALNPNLSVADNVRTGASHVLELIGEFEGLPGHSTRHDELERRINQLEGWSLDHRMAAAMDHLHCPAGDRLVKNLSGGEQRRVALCRALVSRPDLLILDEPTNHLDTESIEWMAGFLESYAGAFLLVTHDRYFLDRITNTIAELSQGRFHCYTGNYTDYLVAQAEREAAAEIVEHKRQMFLRRELEWVRRGPPARTTKSKSRLDRFFEVADRNEPEADREMELVLPPPPPLGNRILELNNVGFTIDGRRLFTGLTLSFAAGQRLGITGRNGLGKSTLLKIMLGELLPTTGTLKLGQLTQFNYVDQGRLQLNDERTVLEEVSDGHEFVLFGDERLSVRAYLKRFLFGDDRMSTQVKLLSGGERSRLLLARILKNGGNFLVLDEPTNDLDLPTLRVLEEALAAFPGVVVVVSHDRYFLNRICTDILAFEGDGQIFLQTGNYDDYAERRSARGSIPTRPLSPPKREKDPLSAQPTADAPARKRKLTFKETRELEGMETVILAAEENIARIEAIFADPDFHRKHGQRTHELTAELAAEKERVLHLYARWEELEAVRSSSGLEQ